MNHAKRAFLGSTLFFALLLSACGTSTSVNTTNTLSAVYTAAAGTVSAQEATSTQPLLDQSLTLTPADTPSEAASLTGLPTLVADLPTSTPGATTLNTSGCNSVYISDVTIPDGTLMSPGQTFVKTWALQNNGSCTWDTGFTLRFFSGDQMSGGSGTVGNTVAPGDQADVSVSLTAPLTAGTYVGNWRMADDSGSTFGEIVNVKIEVDQSVTETPELTETPAYTATATPVTPTAADTSTPTSMPTSVPTTAVPPTSVPTTAVPPTLAPTTAAPPTSVPTTAVPPTPTQ